MAMKSRIFLIFASILFVAGCGYHLAGTGSSLPKHIRTMAIPIFENSSDEPEIHRELTSNVREAFIRDGRLKIVEEKRADLLMKGKLTYYNLRAVSFTTQDVVSEYWVELKVNIDVKDRVKKKTFMKQSLYTKWDFKTSAGVADSETARLAALEDAYRELGNRLVSLVIEQF